MKRYKVDIASRTVKVWSTCVFIVFLISFNTLAQVSSISPGSWDEPSNWSPAGIPDPATQTIIVNHEMSISGDRSWSIWSGSRSVTVNNGGKIAVTGNLLLKGGSTNFIVNGGELEVSGELTIENGGAELTIASGLLDVGVLQVNHGSTVVVAAGANATLGTLNVGNNSSAVFQNDGFTIVSGDISFNGSLVNNGTLHATNIDGGGSGNSVFNNTGTVDVSHGITLPSSSMYNALQGSTTIVNGSVNVSSNENIRIGDSNAPPAYADMLIKGNLTSTRSGDMLIETNGRLAVYGDIIASGGGSYLRLKNGAQAYVQGSIDFSSARGSFIDNMNTELGFIGLYVDGDVLFSKNDGFVGGESRGTQSSTNSGYNTSSDLPGENDDFLAWLKLLEDSPFANPLPIELKNFDAWSEGQVVHIEWVTATEINNEFFEIQRSTDGRVFETIAVVQGAGNSSQDLTYIYEDSPSRSGWWYYRLKQTDFDGQFEVFEMKLVQYEREVYDLSIYPNPTSDFIKWNMSGIIDAMLVTLSGEVVVRKRYGESFYELDLVNVQSAIYILRLTDRDGQTYSSRIVKR